MSNKLIRYKKRGWWWVQFHKTSSTTKDTSHLTYWLIYDAQLGFGVEGFSRSMQNALSCLILSNDSYGIFQV